MKYKNFGEFTNEIVNIEELSSQITDFGYNAARILDKMKDNQEALLGKIKVTIDVTIEVD